MAKKQNKKKKKQSSNNTASVQAQLTSELTNGLTDLAEVTITIPLSKVTKKLHSRMFIKTQLSLPELQNMKQLGEIFKANAYFYNNKYVKNVWFIKKTKITCSSKEESMTLTLTPFNDSYESEANTLSGLTEQKNKTQTTNSTGSSTPTSTTDVKLSTKDPFLADIVKKAIGTKTDKLAMAKACYKYYQDHHVYKYDSTSVEDDYKRGFKSLWNQRGQSCGPGAACLYYMFNAIGLDPKIMNGHNHYWIQVEIDGKTYYCDQAGSEGSHNMCTNGKSRIMSTCSTCHCTVFGGATGGSIRMG
jgi:hypothetical protein